MASCCTFVGVTDLTTLTVTVDCCSLLFKDTATTDLISFYNLRNASIISDGKGGVTLRNGVSALQLSSQDLTDLGLTVSDIETAVSACACSSSYTTPFVGTSNRVTVAVDGSIPTGAISYKITNLGDLTFTNGIPNNKNTWTIDGYVVLSEFSSMSDSLPLGGTFGEIPYLVNGNNLLIEYTTIV
jgi:hypothetical protein